MYWSFTCYFALFETVRLADLASVGYNVPKLPARGSFSLKCFAPETVMGHIFRLNVIQQVSVDDHNTLLSIRLSHLHWSMCSLSINHV